MGYVLFPSFAYNDETKAFLGVEVLKQCQDDFFGDYVKELLALMVPKSRPSSDSGISGTLSSSRI